MTSYSILRLSRTNMQLCFRVNNIYKMIPKELDLGGKYKTLHKTNSAFHL